MGGNYALVAAPDAFTKSFLSWEMIAYRYVTVAIRANEIELERFKVVIVLYLNISSMNS